MNLIKIIVVFFLLLSTAYSQTLFQDDQNLKSFKQSPKVVRSSAPVSATVPKPSVKKHYSLATNLESLILRGDIQVYYEFTWKDQLATVVSAHINPQSTHNDITGQFGVLFGGRHYFKGYFKGFPMYLQGLVGFNHYQELEFDAVIEFGQRANVFSDFYIDTAVVVHRSYYESIVDPNIYIKLNLVMNLPKSLI